MIVRLHQPIVAAAESLDAVDSSNGHARSAAPTLFIDREPVQITGRFYGLVRILAAVDELDVGFQSSGRPDVPAPERFRVVHFNPASRQFDGLEEIVRLPQVIFAQHYGCFPSTTQGIEKSPANVEGWYIYGAKDAAGLFTVQAIAPRGLLRLQPDRVIVGRKPSWHYLKQETWQERAKGTMASVLLCPNGEGQTVSELVNQWQEGDRALLIHVYGGIGGKCKEPAATGPVFFGHFAYGVATVVQEPLAHELRFEIEYHQVYTHNVDGIIAGTLAWNRFLGDRQFGWLGTRPVCDLLIKLDAFTDDYELNGVYQSALQELVSELEEMTARYRIGDGTGGTYVGPAHNCAQDSNQALYAALKDIQGIVGGNLRTQEWLLQNPDQAQRFQQLVKLTRAIKRELLPFGTARADWQNDVGKLGISPEEDVLTSLRMGLISWRTLLPRLASETVAKLFLQQGASIWVLRTNQVGGYDADIEPIAPTPIGC
jgi:predicted Abi (CAAX) family protease